MEPGLSQILQRCKELSYNYFRSTIFVLITTGKLLLQTRLSVISVAETELNRGSSIHSGDNLVSVMLFITFPYFTWFCFSTLLLHSFCSFFSTQVHTFFFFIILQFSFHALALWAYGTPFFPLSWYYFFEYFCCVLKLILFSHFCSQPHLHPYASFSTYSMKPR